MDIEQARTFLAVVDTGSFLAAADKVNVTQSTVSARIKALEDQLRRPLFTRGRSGAEMTSAGRHFYRHAQSMVRSWTQARFDVGLPEGFETFIEIGAQYSLWDGFLSPTLGVLQQHFPDLVFRASMNNSESLTQSIVGGVIDIAVMYRPEARPGLLMRRLFEDEFVLVTSHSDPKTNPFGAGYTFVDWGPDFRADHAREFPTMDIPPLQVEIGTLGLQHLKSHPASGYFPSRILDPLDTTLKIVPYAPRFSYSAYAVYWEDSDDETVDKVVQKLAVSASKLDVSVGR